MAWDAPERRLGGVTGAQEGGGGRLWALHYQALPGWPAFTYWDSKQANFTNNIHLLQESESTMPDMDGLNMGGPTFSVGGGGKKKKGKGKKHWALPWFVFLNQFCRPFSNKFLLDLMIWRKIPHLIRI